MRRNLRRDTNPYCNLSTICHLLIANPDGALVFHSPRACSQYAMAGFWNMKYLSIRRRTELVKYFQNCHFFVTGIREKDTIFGGERLLTECLRDVAALPDVRYIMVASGCTAGIMGDDIPSICHMVEEESGKPIVFLPGAGFMSEHFMKVRIAAMDAVISRLAAPHPEEEKEDAAVLLGENRISMGSGNYNEAARYLSYFGITRILVPPNAMKMEEFQDIAGAKLFIPVSYFEDGFSMMEAYGDTLAARYGAVCVKGNYPAGMAGVKRFLTAVGKALHQEERVGEILRGEERALDTYIAKTGTSLRGKRYVCYLGFPLSTYSLRHHWELLARAGMQCTAVVFSPRLKEKEKEDIRASGTLPAGTFVYDDGSIVAELSRGTDMVLTTESLPGLAHEFCVAVRKAGLAGMKNIIDKAVEAVNGEGQVIVYE